MRSGNARSRKILINLIAALGVLGVAAGTVHGQAFPNKMIRIVTSDPGAGPDILARVTAQGLSARWGQNVIVDNRVGLIAAETVAKASPDGYSLLIYGPAVWLLPFLTDQLPWDPQRDFAPVTLMATSPNILAVHPSLAVNSVKDVIALAKAKPGQLNYSAGGGGSSAELAAELFKSMAGVNIVRVSYKGGNPALIALIAGEVQINFATLGTLSPHLKSGKVKALAATSAQPSAMAPTLPTVAASGLPGYESVVIYAVFVPAKTPAAIVNDLNREIVAIVNRPDAREKFVGAGFDPVGSAPGELATKIKSEMVKWGKVIKDAGLKP